MKKRQGKRERERKRNRDVKEINRESERKKVEIGGEK